MPSVDEINRYADFYKSLPHRAHLEWQLVLADDPQLIAAMERVLELSQEQAVDKFLEDSCWSDDLPHLTGRKGTCAERRSVLRRAYLKSLRSSYKGEADYSLLTPLEEDLYKLLYEVTAAFPEDPHRQLPALKHAKRLLKSTRDHVSQLMAEWLRKLEARTSDDAPEIMWHAFVRSRDYVHLGLYPYTTLCGMEFDGKGNGVQTPTDLFELARKQSPFAECGRAPVTCPDCVQIIRLCKITEVKDLPPEPPFTEEEQDKLLRSIKD